MLPPVGSARNIAPTTRAGIAVKTAAAAAIQAYHGRAIVPRVTKGVMTASRLRDATGIVAARDRGGEGQASGFPRDPWPNPAATRLPVVAGPLVAGDPRGRVQVGGRRRRPEDHQVALLVGRPH